MLVLGGLPASPGAAAGPAWLLDVAVDSDAVVATAARDAERARALAALESAAAELDALAASLSGTEAEIVAAGALMARDPGLAGAVAALVTDGAPAPVAITRACEDQAALLAALDDETLAARADDVRSVGRRAARHASGTTMPPAPPGATSPAPSPTTPPAGAIIVATDLGPADVAELASLAAGFALAAGGPTAHAAIVARSLGIAMVTGAGAGVLDASGEIVVDGDAGEIVLAPPPARIDAARTSRRARDAARARAAAARDLPATTTDGRRITVLANVAASAEVPVALEAGAEGVGLLRTELAFLDARDWPTEAEHRRALDPILAPLAGRPVTVRVLDFGGDKLPPFLRGRTERGIALLLTAPAALAAQLRAIVASSAGARVDLRIMLPLVERAEELDVVRALLPAGIPLGAMIETPAAADAAARLAVHSDFFSIGTNDLTAATVGVDRFAAGDVARHDPRVLRHVASVTATGLPVEVCGEAASDPVLAPLLVGLGVAELSVGASRVGTVRAWMRALSAAICERAAQQALRAADARGVEAEALLLEAGDDAREGVERDSGVVPVSTQA